MLRCEEFTLHNVENCDIIAHKDAHTKKAAFTLAEVLITLGIIGVVAALTLPTLIQHHRKSVVETSLAKFYSVINQTIQRAEVDYGDKSAWNIENVDELWDKYLKPYIQYAEVEDGISSSGETAKYVYFNDGSAMKIDIYSIKNSDGSIKTKTYGGHFLYAPNAKTFKNAADKTVIDKNLVGTKIFYFGFWPNKISSSYETSGGKNIDTFVYHYKKGVEPYVANWDGENESLISDKAWGCNSSASRYFCTAVIQQNGWKIPDDYPLKF